MATRAVLVCAFTTFVVVASRLDESALSQPPEVVALPCPSGQQCVAPDRCPRFSRLASRREMSVHRFRQAICDYDLMQPKICCSVIRDNPPTCPGNYNPLLTEQSSDSECGKSLVRSNAITIGTYPFVARIGFINTKTGETKYPCSGSIVNTRTILTTASCALGSSGKYKLQSVLVGEFDTTTDPDCNSLFCAHASRSHNISYVVKYPSYDIETYKNNIALLRLESPIKFTVTAQSICLASDDYPMEMNNDAVLVGWGKLSQQEVKSTAQQWLPMKILSRADCDYFVAHGYSVEMCAVGPQEPCSGHSGSPLVYKTIKGYFLVGVLSYGTNCDKLTNLPTVFTNIPKYTVWIQENS